MTDLIRERGAFRTIVEPTCGVGNFLLAAAKVFGRDAHYAGFDINAEYVCVARNALETVGVSKFSVQHRDFYTVDWDTFFSERSGPFLVLGNPPWITNAGMGAIGGNNLPEKSNAQRLDGFSAKTGKANFDISEWMIIRLLGALQGKSSVVAMLCKTSTARKILCHGWQKALFSGSPTLHMINAAAEFGVSVDACLLVMQTGVSPVFPTESRAAVFRDLSFNDPLQTFGLADGKLVSDMDAYMELRDLEGTGSGKWRSGVKHDAAKVMEFTRENGSFVNGLGERCTLEEDRVYPLLKSSDLANGRLEPFRYVLLTQKRVGDSTDDLKSHAPMTWKYLMDHAEWFDRRKSSIYRNRPRFSIFAIGDYAFAPYKVAISGFYNNLRFQVAGNVGDKPVMLDNTCYFFPCTSIDEAMFFKDLLNSETARRFLSSLIFRDSKRPVTIDILKRFDLKKLAKKTKQEWYSCPDQ